MANSKKKAADKHTIKAIAQKRVDSAAKLPANCTWPSTGWEALMYTTTLRRHFKLIPNIEPFHKFELLCADTDAVPPSILDQFREYAMNEAADNIVLYWPDTERDAIVPAGTNRYDAFRANRVQFEEEKTAEDDDWPNEHRLLSERLDCSTAYFEVLETFLKWVSTKMSVVIEDRVRILKCTAAHWPVNTRPSAYAKFVLHALEVEAAIFAAYNDGKHDYEQLMARSAHETVVFLRKLSMTWVNDPKKGNKSEPMERCQKYLQSHVFNSSTEWLKRMKHCDSHGIRQDLRMTANGQWLEMPTDHFYSDPLLPRWEKNALMLKAHAAVIVKTNGGKRKNDGELNGDANPKSKKRQRKDRREFQKQKKLKKQQKDKGGPNTDTQLKKQQALKRCRKGKDCWHHKQGRCNFWHPTNPRRDCYQTANCTRSPCPFEHSPEELKTKSNGGNTPNPFENARRGFAAPNPSSNVYRAPSKQESAYAMQQLQQNHIEPTAMNFSSEVYRQRLKEQLCAAMATATPAQIHNSLYHMQHHVANTATATNTGNAAPYNALSFQTQNNPSDPRMTTPSATTLPHQMPQSNPWRAHN